MYLRSIYGALISDLFQRVKTQNSRDFPRFFLFSINFHDFHVQKINDFIVRMGTTHNKAYPMGYMLVCTTFVYIYFSCGDQLCMITVVRVK